VTYTGQSEKRGLSARDKGLLLFAVVAILVAAGAIYWNVRKQMPHVVARINLPPGSSPKVQFMKSLKAKQNGGQAAPAASSSEASSGMP
jgi:hypothetical protein